MGNPCLNRAACRKTGIPAYIAAADNFCSLRVRCPPRFFLKATHPHPPQLFISTGAFLPILQKNLSIPPQSRDTGGPRSLIREDQVEKFCFFFFSHPFFFFFFFARRHPPHKLETSSNDCTVQPIPPPPKSKDRPHPHRTGPPTPRHKPHTTLSCEASTSARLFSTPSRHPSSPIYLPGRRGSETPPRSPHSPTRTTPALGSHDGLPDPRPMHPRTGPGPKWGHA